MRHPIDCPALICRDNLFVSWTEQQTMLLILCGAPHESLSRRPAAQHVPTVFRNPQRRSGFELADLSRGETLRRRAVNFFKFATEMRFISELQLVGSGLIGIALRDQVFSQAALQLPEPMARGATQVLTKEPLELTLGD